MQKMKKVVWSLFDGSGIMGLPWAERGCEVICFNADSGNHGEYAVKMNHPNIRYINMWIDKDFIIKAELLGLPKPDIVFGFPDCTLFAQSGSQHERDDAEMKYALECAKVVQQIGEQYEIPWMIENPVGAMSKPENLGKPHFYFNPRDFGLYLFKEEGSYHPKMPVQDGYTKKTCIWCGNGFNRPEPKPLPKEEGLWFFWGWKFLGGKGAKTKQLRSLTPRGFARAVYMANKFK